MSLELLPELRNPSSSSTQITSLRAVKNDIIGHGQKKQAWIESGIVPILSHILTSRQGLGKYPTGQEPEQDGSRKRLLDEDECCLQAIIIIGSLAQGMFPVDSFIHWVIEGNVLNYK